jgi:hypothetical protein
MRTFTMYVFAPAMVLLLGFAAADKFWGNGVLFRAVMIGVIAGFAAAIAYDVFRLPFVFATQLGIESVVPPMNLFKVFPRFGAMLLNQPIEQAHYSLSAHVVGWIYHFSNGMTFGVMYLALVGDARCHWFRAVLMAVGIEMALLLTPYTGFFRVPLTATFVVVTFAAHLIFGVAMGFTSQRLSRSMLRFTSASRLST